MASEVLTQTHIDTDSPNQPARPIETLQIEEPHNEEENIVFPTGPKLWSTMASMCIALFLSGLDITIVAVAVPSITDEFQTIADIGWYSAAYGMSLSAFVFFFGQIYTLFSTKVIFLIGIATFEVGALVCTLAPSSAVFILGRAISGLGRGAINGGLFKLLKQCFPLSKQAMVNSLLSGVGSLGLITAPTIGGALVDAFSWRACFGINIPLGVLCLILTAYGVHEAPQHRENGPVLTVKEKLNKVDYLGTLLAVPAVTCLLMALQWGGTKFGWGSWQIILPLVFSALLFTAFGYLQYHQGDKALLPPRILKQRSIIAGMWFGACCEGVLAVTEYYMSIYFQGVRGYTPTKAGLLALPMVGGLAIAFVVSGLGTTWLGYYYPFMLATSVLTPIISGLLTTIDLQEQVTKAVVLLALLGLTVGLGLNSPMVALQAVLPAEDVSLGGAVLTFGAGMGSALWICASATLFQDRLASEIKTASPETNVEALQKAGLSKMRESIGPERLKNVLNGYEDAVIQTLYIPLALAVLTIIGSVAMEPKWPSNERFMASPYRVIKPALSRDRTFRKAPHDRGAPKRTGMIKSACWECRKRKAKCNGLKPACGNCAKWEAECIYDADVRDAEVRNLQDAKEKLEAELDAAKTLLKQVASGPDQIRSIVLELLENAKEPLEMLEELSNGEGRDTTMADSQVPHVTTLPTLPVEGVLPDAEHFSELMEASPSLQPPQVLLSQTAIASHILRTDMTDTVHSQSNSNAISCQSEPQSLFFKPLFTHTDFYLTTVSDVPERALHDDHYQRINHINTKPHREPSAASNLDSYSPSQPHDPANGDRASAPILGINPNFRNHFNNLSLSNSIRANGYPSNIQEAQIRNIFVPNWAATSLNIVPDPGHLDDAFGDIYKQATSLLKSGEPLHRIAGHHPNIAALYDQQEFDRSCLLSQWAARMVHSVKRQGYDFTCFASMNVFWYMMRWMIDPSPESYAAMPEWIRPSPNQLFTPHISMADFVLWPSFRELVVQLPHLQERMAWLADMSLYIKCDWPYPLEQALHRNPVSGDIDLVDLAKVIVFASC
ncbi:hc-toxin efflux carrier toxa [Fusarium longipes]|uniref:Hc-toxin efflux carrier toxa n=1 Tax=Fusarium longipes TaxID=694270 RepID=A0A395T7M9_9HYPO|nr:hc-toxin efflux carrier toxa [Fusarium longipes]